jgi:hypothetical protein
MVSLALSAECLSGPFRGLKRPRQQLEALQLLLFPEKVKRNTTAMNNTWTQFQYEKSRQKFSADLLLLQKRSVRIWKARTMNGLNLMNRYVRLGFVGVRDQASKICAFCVKFVTTYMDGVTGVNA